MSYNIICLSNGKFKWEALKEEVRQEREARLKQEEEIRQEKEARLKQDEEIRQERAARLALEKKAKIFEDFMNRFNDGNPPSPPI